MNASEVAVRSGLKRGWIEQRNSLRTPEDLTYYLFTNGLFAFFLIRLRDNQIEGTDISIAHFITPSVLALMVVFGTAYGLATTVTTEREDGTLLRAKSVPNGMTGYVVGHATRTTLEVIVGTIVILGLGTLLVDNLWINGPAAVVATLVLVLLGILACAPIGFALGSLFKNARAIGGWGMLVMGGLVYVSGIFSVGGGPPRWAEMIGQVFPLHWLAETLRAVILPDESFPWVGVAVLVAWAVIGMVLAPVLLRRMARRESGSAVSERREKALTRV